MGIRADYQDRLQSGELKQDPAQALVVERLEQLSRALEHHQSRKNGLLARLLRNGATVSPKGLYMWGDVGRGKTMLMDAFFAGAPVERKRRAHFHGFMRDVHARLHRARRASNADDPVADVARELAVEAQLLCLDEMQISDIADAMIVGRLFEQLLDRGVIVVMTSNLSPDALYKDGLNRDLFVPFIRLIEQKLDVVEVETPTDYRLGRIRGLRTFITPLGREADAKVQHLWEKLTDTKRGDALFLEILGRKLAVPQHAHGAARFTFGDLCEAPLGPPDYLALAATFKLIFIENIPLLQASQRNPAKRFILLIDTLYDAHVRLVASSQMPPEGIYGGQDHRQEFARTASRLEEMQSASWWGARIADT
jgi:cell division protein ZapE